jgi:hypothetical protein
MSRWTTLPLSLILLILSAVAVRAADALPRNIELKPGADTSATADKTRQIVTEGKDAVPQDAGGKPDTPKEGEGASTVATPEAPPPGPSPVTLRPEELVIAVQTELKRVGCYPGEIDGAWGDQSRGALAAFGHAAKVDVVESAPTPEILVIIKGKSETVCVADAAPAAEHEATPQPNYQLPSHGGGYYGGSGY